jgi:hypothetical protein
MQACDKLAQRAETETNTEYEGRDRCKLAISWGETETHMEYEGPEGRG